MKYLIVLLAMSVVIKSGHGMVVNLLEEINNHHPLRDVIQERLALLEDENKFPLKFRPELLQVFIRGFMPDERSSEGGASDNRQIPVISDIERIKKIVQIIEFVGEKVGAIIDNLPAPQSLVGDEISGAVETKFGKEDANTFSEEALDETAVETTTLQ